MLLMLEDNDERVQRFTEVLRIIDPSLPLMVWRDAKVMVREVGPHLPAARLISLDHDLEPLEGAADPGDGLEVVKFLVSQAAAYAENGDYARAVAEQEKVLADKSLDKEDREKMEKRLALYKDNKPYHDND